MYIIISVDKFKGCLCSVHLTQLLVASAGDYLKYKYLEYSLNTFYVLVT